MAEEWVEQMKNQVNTLEKLRKYIKVFDGEREAIESLKTKWGTTPYFASLMDKDNPNCPIRKQVIPSMKEQVNKYGIENYLIMIKSIRAKRFSGRSLVVLGSYGRHRQN